MWPGSYREALPGRCNPRRQGVVAGDITDSLPRTRPDEYLLRLIGSRILPDVDFSNRPVRSRRPVERALGGAIGERAASRACTVCARGLAFGPLTAFG